MDCFSRITNIPRADENTVWCKVRGQECRPSLKVDLISQSTDRDSTVGGRALLGLKTSHFITPPLFHHFDVK